MATAATAVKQILNQINIRASEAPLEADEVQDTITMMNTYMSALAADGVNLGYTQVSDLGDTITIPDGALLGMYANVAILMASTFGRTPSQPLVVQAKIGLDAMRKLGVSVPVAEYPSTLPLGSGNEHDNFSDRRFYPDSEPTIATESGGSIGLEASTDV